MSESNPIVTITSVESLRDLKKAIRAAVPGLGSGHAGECIARSLRRSTHDGLVFELRSGSITTETDPAAFAHRAAELGYAQTNTATLEAVFVAAMNGLAAKVRDTSPPTADQVGRAYARANLGADAKTLAIDGSTGLPLPNPGSVECAKEALFAAGDWRSVAEDALSVAGYEPEEDGNFENDLLDEFWDGVVRETARMAAEIAAKEANRLANAVSELSFRDVVEALQEGRLAPEAVDFEDLGRVHAADLIGDGTIDFDVHEDDFENGIEGHINSGRNDVLYAAEAAGYDCALAREVADEYVSGATEVLREAWAVAQANVINTINNALRDERYIVSSVTEQHVDLHVADGQAGFGYAEVVLTAPGLPTITVQGEATFLVPDGIEHVDDAKVDVDENTSADPDERITVIGLPEGSGREIVHEVIRNHAFVKAMKGIVKSPRSRPMQ